MGTSKKTYSRSAAGSGLSNNRDFANPEKSKARHQSMIPGPLEDRPWLPDHSDKVERASIRIRVSRSTLTSADQTR